MAQQRQTLPTMVEGFNSLGLGVVKQIAAGELRPEDGNLCVSGLSLGLALLMTLWGAQGDTADEIAVVLGLQGAPEVPAAARALMTQLVQSQPDTTLLIANALWARGGVALAEPFVSACQQALDATLEVLDFGDPAAAQRINGWVAEATRGLIPSLVPDQIHPLTMLFITNVLYFKGTWAEPFEAALTQRTPFECWDGQPRPAEMMRHVGAMAYLENDLVQAVQLDYVGGELALEVYLPRQRLGLAALLADLQPQQLMQWSRRFARRPGALSLPRFRVSNQWVLNQPLMALGMRLAFDSGRADFGGMTSGTGNPGLHISRVLHNTVLQVDEQGAEAAAATAVEMRLRSMAPPEPPFAMLVDHPFLVVLREKVSGAALMQAAVGKPIDPGA